LLYILSPPEKLNFLHRLLDGIRAELRAIAGVVLLLRWPVHLTVSAVLAICFLGVFGTQSLVIAGQGLIVLAVGLAGIFSGYVARYLRRWRWVRFADGHEVAAFLPQTLTLMLFPAFFIALTVWLFDIGQRWHGFLPVRGWPDALALAGDQFLHLSIFFGFFDIFGLRLAAWPNTLLAGTLAIVCRLLLDVAFVKLAVQVGKAAYFRARGLGRGEDKVALLRGALAARDVPQAQFLAQDIGDSLCQAVDALQVHAETRGPRSGEAWACLHTMDDFALPYLDSKYHTAEGDQRRRLGELTQQLRVRAAERESVWGSGPRRRWPAKPLGGVLLVGGVLLWLGPAGLVLGLSLVLTGVLGWMVITSRRWVDRLVGWGLLRPCAPDRLAWRMAQGCLVLLPLLIVIEARLFQSAAAVTGGVFALGADRPPGFLSCVAFVLENLLRTQVFLHISQVYDLQVTRLAPSDLLGALLTFLIRLIFNLGILSLLISLGMVWFNRLFRRLDVSPNAELLLREEALECGPHASLLIGYHFRHLRAFFQSQPADHAGTEFALRAVGFSRALPAVSTDPVGQIEISLEVGSSFLRAFQLDSARQELERALRLAEALPPSRQRQEFLLAIHFNLGVSLVVLEDFAAGLEHMRFVSNEAAHFPEEGLTEDTDFMGMLRLFILLCQYRTGALPDPVGPMRATLAQMQRATRSEIAFFRVQALATVAQVLRDHGALEEALLGYRQALAGLEGSTYDPNLEGIYRFQLGQTLARLGDLAEAVAEARTSMAILEEAHREGQVQARAFLRLSCALLSQLYLARGDFAEARQCLHQYQEITIRFVQQGHKRYLADVASAHMLLGLTEELLGRLEPALGEYQGAVAVCAPFQDDGALAGPGRLAGPAGVPRQGVPTGTPPETRALLERIAGAAHKAILRVLVRQGFSELAVLPEKEQRPDDIEPHMDDFVGLDPPARVGQPAGWERRVCDLHRLGRIEYATGDRHAALACCRQAHQVVEQNSPGDHPLRSAACTNVGHCLFALRGQAGEPGEWYETARDLEEKRFGHADVRLVPVLLNLAGWHLVRHRHDEAGRLYQRCDELLAAAHKPPGERVKVVLAWARVLGEQQDYAGAGRLCKRAIGLAADAGDDVNAHITALHNLGLLASRQGDGGRRLELGRRALQLCEQRFGPEHRHTAYSLSWLARTHLLLRQPAEAIPLARRALAIRKALLPAEHPEIRTCLEMLAQACLDVDDFEAALECYRAMDLPRAPGNSVFWPWRDAGGTVRFFLVCGQARLVPCFSHNRRVQLALRRARLKAHRAVGMWLGEQTSFTRYDKDGQPLPPTAGAGPAAEVVIGGRNVHQSTAQVQRSFLDRLVPVRRRIDELDGTVALYLAYHSSVQPGEGAGALRGEYEVKTVTVEERPSEREWIKKTQVFMDRVLVESLTIRRWERPGAEAQEEGNSTEWYPDGRMYSQIISKTPGYRLERAWYESGQLAGELSWEREGETGTVTYWHENGQKRQEMTYQDGELEGPEIHCDEQGNEVQCRQWRKGILQG